METTERKKVRKSKRRFLKFRTLMIFLILVWWFNNYTLKTTHIELTSEKISGNVRIAVISDCHSKKYGISNKAILRRISANNPDIVFVMGDMYTQPSPPDIIQIPVDLTADIVRAGYPVYFVTGEHDTDDSYIEAMQKAGAVLMNYSSQIIEVNGNNIQLMGIDNVYYSPTFNLNNAFSLNPECYSILMAHIPNYEKFSLFGADLTVCADTHGGMIQLPFIGALIDSESMTLFPELLGLTVYDKGLFDYQDGTMFITSGIGASPAPVRFCNRPEIAVIDIGNK
ncbi:MAG: metallophosphoesterase [Ruminococcus sp.]|nr:metallophosphoesterase [Ruminococcus sp.]